MSQVLVVSKDSPYTVQDALDKCAPGGRVAVLSGIHEGPFTITKPVHLMGHAVRGNPPLLWAKDELFTVQFECVKATVMEGFLVQGKPPTRRQLFQRGLRWHMWKFR